MATEHFKCHFCKQAKRARKQVEKQAYSATGASAPTRESKRDFLQVISAYSGGYSRVHFWQQFSLGRLLIAYSEYPATISKNQLAKVS